MIKWKNLKTNPSKSETMVLIREIYSGLDKIVGVCEYYRTCSKTYSVGQDNQYKDEYLIQDGIYHPYHTTSSDIYYIPIDELKQIEIDKL